MAKRRMHLMGYVVAGPTWHHNGSWRHARSDVPDLLSASETVQNLGVITPVRSDGHVVRFEMRRNHPQVLDGLFKAFGRRMTRCPCCPECAAWTKRTKAVFPTRNDLRLMFMRQIDGNPRAAYGRRMG